MILKAGNLEMLYEKGFLRHLRLGSQEILRMIYFAVRDQDWNTVASSIIDESIVIDDSSFLIQYGSSVQSEKINYDWKVRIEGFKNGTIEFNINGTAQSNFLKNRIGFCVLHPIEGLAGMPCQIVHTGGETSDEFFPDNVSPHQPFMNIREMFWNSGNDVRVHLKFIGDIFETEDQRNWTDASYKTYCTPLALPFPQQVNVGDTVHQKIILRLVEGSSMQVPKKFGVIEIEVGSGKKIFPALGLGMNAENILPDENETIFLAGAGFNHLRLDLHFSRPDWKMNLRNVLNASRALKIKLHIAIFWQQDFQNDLSDFIATVQDFSGTLHSLLLFDEEERNRSSQLPLEMISQLRHAFPDVRIGSGTDAYFAELNRSLLMYDEYDFVSFSINPQVHAFDDLTLIENLPAQSDVVKTIRRRMSDKQIYVSPVTLRPRFNPDNTSGDTSGTPLVDHRQQTDLAAGWTLGSLKYLAEAGVSSVTYFETTGSRGIVSGQKIFPVGVLLESVLRIRPKFVIETRSGEPLKISSLLLENDSRMLMFIGNHTASMLSVQLPSSLQPLDQLSVLKSESVSCFTHNGKSQLEIDAFDVVLVLF